MEAGIHDPSRRGLCGRFQEGTVARRAGAIAKLCHRHAGGRFQRDQKRKSLTILEMLHLGFR